MTVNSGEEEERPRITAQDLLSFEADLRTFHWKLTQTQWDSNLARSTPTGHDRVKREAEKLRRELVRRAGRYKEVVDRLNGGPVAVQRSPAAGGGVLGEVWQVALAADSGLGPPYGLDQLANRVAMAAGMLEGDPSLATPSAPQRPNRETSKLSSFEQERQTMIEKLLELRGTAGYANPTKLAPLLGRSLIDIADHAWTLDRQGFVKIIPVGDQRGPEGGDQPGILDIRLTDLGVQRAKEGYQAVASQPSVQQTNNNTFLTTGGTLNVAQTGQGDVFQHIEQPNNLAEIGRLLADMKQALAGSDVEVDKREEGLVYIEQLTVELQQPKPRPSMLKIPWTSLGRIADIAGVTQSGAIVLEAYRQLEPLITPMLKAAGG
jgi:hypothetical protein